MTRISIAQERLDSAIARVEAALNQRQNVRGDEADRPELLAALDAALKDNKNLQEVTGIVSSRLDATIERLEHLLKD